VRCQPLAKPPPNTRSLDESWFTLKLRATHRVEHLGF
jgi:hypothetical protein